MEISKAYNTIRWSFIWDVLDAMGLPPLFIKWICVCVSSASFSVSINGGLHGFFRSSRGLRQGDPLSPYLFVLAMNVLSKILDNKVQSADFKFHWRCAKLNLCHLSFADDLLLFANNDIVSCSVLRYAWRILRDCQVCDRMSIKVNVFFASTSLRLKEDILQIFGFPEGHLPIRYLGALLITSRLKGSDCIPLLEKIKNKLNSWTNRHLSFAAHLTLINSVLLSSQIFWCSHFILPCVFIGT